jgi:hypothetical protein
MYDFIGDIHGYADHLEALLRKLGYEKRGDSYAHPERKVFFVGDFIDRGAKIPETLRIVRNMVENEQALAIMGNHEYNALCFHYPHPDGGHLRPHTINNLVQHLDTIKQYKGDHKTYEDMLEWFKTLPLYYEDKYFRATHACWDPQHIDVLRKRLLNDRLDKAFLYESASKETPFYDSVEVVLKGKEIAMPNGLFFDDKEGHRRTDIRIKWWEDPASSSYRKLSVVDLEQLPDAPVDLELLPNTDYYKADECPVFFGHYWLSGEPSLLRPNICCLDFSVAKGGVLAAYRFDGEQQLDVRKLVWV